MSTLCWPPPSAAEAPVETTACRVDGLARLSGSRPRGKGARALGHFLNLASANVFRRETDGRPSRFEPEGHVALEPLPVPTRAVCDRVCDQRPRPSVPQIRGQRLAGPPAMATQPSTTSTISRAVSAYTAATRSSPIWTTDRAVLASSCSMSPAWIARVPDVKYRRSRQQAKAAAARCRPQGLWAPAPSQCCSASSSRGRRTPCRLPVLRSVRQKSCPSNRKESARRVRTSRVSP